MSDSFRETTSTSWFGRIGRSIGGVLFGLLLLVVCVVVLFWNEGRAVQTARSLAEGAGIVVSVPPDKVDTANEGKLVHATGQVTTDATLSDPTFGITASGVRLSRNVEMYQWQESSSSETKKKLGGGEETVTTYSYSRGWSSSQVNSASFKKPDGHENPPMSIHSEDFRLSQAGLGAFTLDSQVLDRIGGGSAMPLAADKKEAVAAAFGTDRPVSISAGTVYVGPNPSAPAVGDYRVSYELVPLGQISIVARQTGSSFAPYQTKAGDRLLMVDNGAVPADQMFSDAISSNTVLTWIVRAAGLLFLAVAFGLLLAPLGVIGDVIPFVGSLVRMGTGIVAFVMAILVGSIVIALAWFWYRPILALAVLAAGILITFLFARMGRRRAAAPPEVKPSG